MLKRNASVNFRRRVLTCLGCFLITAIILLVVPVTLP
ncbi:MAG: hypothetical protein V7641_343, partial [Blastocatellia bacterium]